MRVLLDTNVLIDYLINREQFGENASKIVTLCQQKKVLGAISAQSFADVFYILRKYYSNSERRQMLSDICKIFHVEGIDERKIKNALANFDFIDFEDCLQAECAVSFGADYIITRNIKDFSESSVPCLAPEQFLAKYF